MKVLWTHNFSPDNPVAGNFMYILKKGMQEMNVEIDLEYLGNLRSPFELVAARRRVKKLSAQYDLVHAQFGSACAYASAECLVPNIVSLRGSDWHVYKGKNAGLTIHNYLAAFLSRISLRRYAEVVVMSERMAAEVRKFLGRSNVFVVPDAVDDAFFTKIDKMEARAHLGESNNRNPWVLFTTVSVDNPVKRAALAMEAVEHARKSGAQIELRVASGIPPSEMPLFVSACDMVLCTSTHEGWPNSVKEALACGLPFVSTDVSDLHLIANKYPACRVVEPDPIELGDSILHVLKQGDVKGLALTVEHMNVMNTCALLKRRYISVLSQHATH